MTQLRRGLVPGVFVLLAVPGFNASADSHASPPVQPALEAFFCNYNPGKDRDDLDSATNFYMKQAKKAGFTTPNAFLWTHNKGTAPADIVWMNVHESLVAYGASDDAAAASSEMADVNDRYDSVATCQAGLGIGTPIITPDPAAAGLEMSTLAAYACTFRHGVGPDALVDLRNHIRETNEGMGDAGLAAAFQIEPMTGGANASDVVFVAVAESTEAWAANLAMLNSTPAGQLLVRHFNMVVDCDMNLWWSEQVVGGEG
jgi:hypothetical protein